MAHFHVNQESEYRKTGCLMSIYVVLYGGLSCPKSYNLPGVVPAPQWGGVGFAPFPFQTWR